MIKVWSSQSFKDSANHQANCKCELQEYDVCKRIWSNNKTI